MKVTYYGHSCFGVLAEGKHILFDPFISPNPLAKEVSVEKIQADYIFLSHAHFDHVFDAVAIAKRTGAQVIGNFEIYQWLQRQGIANAFPLNPGGKFTFPFGTVKCVAAQHSSSFEDGSYGGVACGFVFQTTMGCFYYSGDAALSADMALIPTFTSLDFAILPIGDTLTMGIEEAIEASKMVGVQKVMGVHYDTFPWIPLNHSEAQEKFRANGITLDLPSIGESIEIKKGR